MTELKTTEIDAARYWSMLEKRIYYNGVAKEELIQLLLFAIAISCLPSSDPLVAKISSPYDNLKHPRDGREIINNIRQSAHEILNALQAKYVIACNFFNVNSKFHLNHGNSLDQICQEMLNDIYGMDTHELKAIFEYGFTQTQKEQSRSSFEIEQYASHFAATIINPNTRHIIDAYGEAGEFPLQIFKNTSNIDIIWFPFPQRLNPETLLRLILNGINHDSIIIGTERRTENIQFDISFCGTGYYSNSYNRLPNNGPQHEYAEKFSPGYFANKSKLSVVVATRSDAVRSGNIKSMRKNILNNGTLLAITNAPNSISKLSSRISIWVIKNKIPESQVARKPIAIDANALSHLISDDSKHDLYGFIACLLSLAQPESINNSFGMRFISQNEILNQLFTLAFKGAYRNIPGFCQQITPEQMPETNYSFWANSYIEKHTPEPWLSGLDYANILREIHNAPPSKSLILYIIGDNGQGKSMLLKDFLTNQSSGFTKVLAISNGTHDRFLKKDGTRYKYLGSTPPGINSKQDSTIAGYALATFENAKNSDQWKKIRNILQTIGISPEFYLLHSSAQITKNSKSGDLASIITLPPRSDFDTQSINNILSGTISLKDFHLGVSLLRDENTITKYSELSSGEQNILSIILKIAAHVENNSLILIDEPEISLHVRWQRILPRIIEQLTESYSTIAIIATHSPIIIAEASGENDRCYSAENRETKLIEKHNKRSIESLMFESFKTHTINNREVHEKCAQLLRESIEIANANEKNLDTIESNINKMKEMQAIVANNKNIQSSNAASFQNDQLFIDSVIDALERIKAHITDQK